MTTATVSSEGHIVLPKKLLGRHGWKAGARIVVEETAQGVFLRTTYDLTPTTIDDVIGCTGYKGPPKTIEQMDEGVRELASREGRRMRRRYR